MKTEQELLKELSVAEEEYDKVLKSLNNIIIRLEKINAELVERFGKTCPECGGKGVKKVWYDTCIDGLYSQEEKCHECINGKVYNKGE